MEVGRDCVKAGPIMLRVGLRYKEPTPTKVNALVGVSWKVRVGTVPSSDPSCYRQQSWRASIINLSITASNLARRRYKSSGTPFCLRLVGILVLRPHLSMCLNCSRLRQLHGCSTETCYGYTQVYVLTNGKYDKVGFDSPYWNRLNAPRSIP